MSETQKKGKKRKARKPWFMRVPMPKIRRLYLGRDRALRRMKEEVAALRAQKKYQEAEEREHWGYFDLQEYDDEITLLIQRKLIRKASRLFVEIASGDEYWERSNVTGEHLLKPAGIQKIRSAIRQEKKEHREAAGFWFTAVIGLIGAITGLMAVILD